MVVTNGNAHYEFSQVFSTFAIYPLIINFTETSGRETEWSWSTTPSSASRSTYPRLEQPPQAPRGGSGSWVKSTLCRGAIEYIRALQDLLDDHDAVSAAFSTACPLNTMVSYEAQSTPSDGFSSSGLASPSSLSSGLASPGSSSLCSGGSIGQETEECPLSPDEQDLLDFASWFE